MLGRKQTPGFRFQHGRGRFSIELYAESLKRIALSNENDFRRFLLSECLEAYVNLDEAQQQKFKALLNSEQFREAKPLMVTTYERGKAEGKLEDRRETAILLLETRFGPLSSGVQQRVAEMKPEQLRQLLTDLIKAPSLSLKELRLED